MGAATADGLGASTATVLFSDVVGSTEQRVALGDVRADALRRRHDEALTEVVDRHGGTVVKSLGDGLMATFVGASEGAAAAVDVHREIVRLNRQADDAERLAVRVGLSAGDVSWEDGDCHGTPVVTAARLCAEADGGQILCDDLVRGLARGRSELSFSLVGELELKGLGEPTVTYTIPWEAPAEYPVAPLPGALRPSAGELPYGGRDGARAELFDRWKEAVAASSSTVLIAGEPGIGKTRLTAELAREVQATGGVVALGRCDEYVQAPLAPWSEALRTLVGLLDDGALAVHAGALGRVVPELAGRADPTGAAGDPETERLRLYDAALAVVTEVSRTAPLLLVVDDAHWADAGSVALLRHLTGRLDPDAEVLVVVTFRDTDVDRQHALGAALSDLRRTPRTHQITLRGFDEDGIRSFLEAAGGHPLDRDEDDAFVRRLAAETEGNPFFITELLRHMVQTGLLVQDADGRWSGSVSVEEGGIPAGVRDLVGQRLAQFDEDLNELLRAGAVIGREFELSLLAEVVDRTEDDVVDAIDTVLATRLIEEVPDVYGVATFQHALVRQTLLEEVSTNRRVRLHRRIAEALERRPATPNSVLAHHFGEAAVAGVASKAVDYAVAAAYDAVKAFAVDDAFEMLAAAGEAIEALDEPDPATGARVMILEARLRHWSVEPDRAKSLALQAADVAREVDDPSLLAEAGQAYLGETGMWVTPGDPVGVAILEEALERLPADATAERARAAAARAFALLLAPGSEGFEAAQAALEQAEAAGETEAALRCHLGRAWTVLGCMPFDEAAGLVDESLEAARGAGYRTIETGVWYQRGRLHIAQGQFDEAERALVEANRFEGPMKGWSSLGFAATRALAEGRFDEAIELSERSYPLGTTIGETNEVVHRGRLLIVHRFRGDLAEAHREAESCRDSPLWAGSLTLIALTLAEGDIDATRRLLADYVEIFPLVPNLVRIYAMVNFGEAVFALGDTCGNDEAEAWFDTFTAGWAGGDATLRGSCPFALGLVRAGTGRLDEAVDLLRAGHAEHLRLGTHAIAARSGRFLGEVLLRRGRHDDVDDARGLLRETVELADRLGMTPTAEEAQAALDG